MFKKIVLLVVILLLGGCAVPTTHGPYYKPSYPDMKSPDSPWLPYFGSAVQSRLRFKFNNDCFMELQAIPADSDFLLSWGLEAYGKNRDACHFAIGNESLSIEDTKTGKHFQPESVYRIFSRVFKADLDFGSGMQAYSPDFSALPPDQQTYTVSLHLRLDFDKKIPASISIRLPDVLVGDQQVPIPVLTLKRVETGGNIKAYLPVDPLPMTDTESITSFGMGTSYHRTRGAMAAFFAGASLWYEKKGELRVASSFSGRDDVKTSTMITPEVSGEILVKVMSGKGIRFADSRVVWVTEDGKEIIQHIDPNKLGLIAYRTRLTDVVKFSNEILGPRFVILLPTFHPERARLTLPRLDVNGRAWPLKPIDFEYKSGGVGFVAWP